MRSNSKAAEDQQPKHWYIVTGRVIGDDEDTSVAFEAVSEDAARGLYAESMLGDYEQDPFCPDEPVVVVNSIWDCGCERPRQVYSI